MSIHTTAAVNGALLKMESESEHSLSARWELVRLSPSRIVFDVHRHVSRGCHANDTAGISVIGRTTTPSALASAERQPHSRESVFLM